MAEWRDLAPNTYTKDYIIENNNFRTQEIIQIQQQIEKHLFMKAARHWN